MYPQPPSNEDGFFGRSEPDFDQGLPVGGEEVDENSWLLDESGAAADAVGQVHEAVQPLPGEFNERLDTLVGDAMEGESQGFDPDRPEEALEAFADGLTKTDPMLGASFVEPEPATRVISRTLIPAGAALLVSFCGIAVWAFVKKPVSDVSPEDIQVAAPDVVDSLEGKQVDFVTPLDPDSVESSGRISYQRDGSTKVVGGKNGAPGATVKNPREPGEVSNKGNDKRQSFSSFGGASAATNPKDTIEVEKAPFDESVDSTLSASEFGGEVDEAVTAEALDAFAALEEDMFLPQDFVDSFVLSIDPISNVASIYGDMEPGEAADSFADLEFNRSEPFTSQGFGNFGIAQWEGMGESSAVAGLDSADQQEYEVFLPFGMFNDEDDVELVASVEVGAEDSVTSALSETKDEVEELSEVVAQAAEEVEAEAKPEVEAVVDTPASEDPLLALFGLPEGAEMRETPIADLPEPIVVGPERVIAEAEPELEDSVMDEIRLDFVAEAIADAAPEAIAEAEIQPEVAAEVEPEMIADAIAEVEAEPMNELKSELDVASAHARLDAMFGDYTPSEEPAPVSAEPLELVAEMVVEPAVETEEPDVSALIEQFSTDAPVEAPMAVEEPDEVLMAEVEAPEAPDAPVMPEAKAMEEEPAAEVMLADVTAEPTVEPMADSAVDQAMEVVLEDRPEPKTAVEPMKVEVLDSIVDEAATTRYASALRRSDESNVWSKRTVPRKEVSGDKFLLTPNVGNVRIIFDGGESIDGRLHGVGDQKIILDTKLGRMTLDGRRADRIDRLGGGKRAELRSPSDSYASTKGLDRVKVRAPGGVFYGFLVSQTDEKVTLMLDSGVRVTLNSTEVETDRARKSASRLRSR